jgi:hypothetical protein
VLDSIQVNREWMTPPDEPVFGQQMNLPPDRVVAINQAQRVCMHMVNWRVHSAIPSTIKPCIGSCSHVKIGRSESIHLQICVNPIYQSCTCMLR